MQTYKIYWCNESYALDKLFELLDTPIPSTIKNVLMGENKFTLDLKNRFERLEIDDEDDLWGVLRYEYHRIKIDFDGNKTDNVDFGRGPFVFTKSNNNKLYLILYGRKEHRTRVINVLNKKMHPSVELIREQFLSGEIQGKFKELNPHTPTMQISQTNIPGWKSLRVSGSNITKPPSYNFIESITEEYTSSGMELHNLQWKVILNKGGTVQCWNNVDSHDFLRFIKARILTLIN